MRTRNLPTSPKRFISFFSSKYMMRQIYLIHKDGLRQRKDREVTRGTECVKHCFRHSTSFKATLPGKDHSKRKHAPVCLSFTHATLQHYFTSDLRCVGFLHIKQFCNSSWLSYNIISFWYCIHGVSIRSYKAAPVPTLDISLKFRHCL